MEAVNLPEITASFQAFRTAAGFGSIQSTADYQRAIALVDAILEAAPAATPDTGLLEDANHPLSQLLDFVSAAVERYEAEHCPIPSASPREVLHFLIQEHGLTQSDLPEVGNQSVISQILAGKRQLNARQIAALSHRFGVSADAFIEHAGLAA